MSFRVVVVDLTIEENNIDEDNSGMGAGENIWTEEESRERYVIRTFGFC
jgi:hypothetical protein